MKPPLSSPDGKMYQDELPDYNGQELSISYRLSVLSLARLLLKIMVVSPAKLILVAITICLPVVMTLSVVEDISGFNIPIWIALIVFAAFFAVCSFFSVPFVAYGQLSSGGREKMLKLNNEGVSEVSEVPKPDPITGKTPTFKPVTNSCSWKKIRWIMNWSGDIFMFAFVVGVCVPREAFHSEEEREKLIGAARWFQHKAR